MSLSKLNYDTLNEEFCYWYIKVYDRFPNNNAKFSKSNLIKTIWSLKRSFKIKQRSNYNEVI